jgi:hypothetical protein
MADDWRDELSDWLRPFVAKLGDRRRARICPADVEGLIGPRGSQKRATDGDGLVGDWL